MEYLQYCNDFNKFCVNNDFWVCCYIAFCCIVASSDVEDVIQSIESLYITRSKWIFRNQYRFKVNQ